MFKPMKPASKLINPKDMKKWPKLASIKFDGVRGVTSKEGVLSNSLKLIPNLYVQRILSTVPAGLDGELVLRGDKGKLYDNNQSAFMSVHGEPDFVFKAFDFTDLVAAPFAYRLSVLTQLCADLEFVEAVNHIELNTPKEAEDLYNTSRSAGYEGLILRDPEAPYKHGRSTVNQEWGLKMKPYDPDEAIVIGLTELHHNENEQALNEMGNNVRSKHQDGKVPGGTLGSLICLYGDNEFKIGTGFSAEQRQEIWDNFDNYKSKYVRFKHQGITKSGVPRGPAVYLGWRDKIDIGD